VSIKKIIRHLRVTKLGQLDSRSLKVSKLQFFGNRQFLREIERPERETDHSASTNSKVKKTWVCTAAFPYLFMAWYLLKHSKNFNFYHVSIGNLVFKTVKKSFSLNLCEIHFTTNEMYLNCLCSAGRESPTSTCTTIGHQNIRTTMFCLSLSALTARKMCISSPSATRTHTQDAKRT
jgi:hypothetical protein